MPPVAYFLGKVGLVAVTSVAQLALLLLVARVVFDVPMPSTPSAWATFAWVFLLGVASGTVLGIAYSSLAGSARSAGAVVIGPLLVLQFISGVYFAYSDIPSWMQQVAALFPLKWVAQGMRSVFYPAVMETQEVASAWEHPMVALVLTLWLAAGLVLCTRTFTWFKRGSV
jgi:ABC-2 type transport system permease protein